MDLSELKTKLRGTNLHPVEVEGGADSEEGNGHIFKGPLEEYMETLNKLGHSAVFIATDTLEEDDFFYETESETHEEEENEESEIEDIDLRLLNPSLEKFKNNLTQVGGIRLFSALSRESLEFYIEKDWWVEFIGLRSETIEKIENDKTEAYEKIKEVQKEKEKELLKSLRTLIKDPNFQKFGTQRAMKTYALEKIADLETLDPKILKEEIQKLWDKIK